MALPVIFLGDSHVKYMASAQWHHLFSPRRTSIHDLGGATAVPMKNPNTKLNAFEKFNELLAGQDKNSIIVIHLGEADCGFVMWYHEDKNNEPVAEQLAQSITSYFEFIDALLAQGFKHIVITGATLPTITDAEQAAKTVKSRSTVTVTQRQRTDLTLDYNQRLKDQAQRRQLQYTDITEDVLDAQTRLVRPEFRNANPAELIMNQRAVSPFWAERLNACFEIYDPLDAQTYEFKAKTASFAKGLSLHSNDIPADLKVAVKENDHLTAKFHEDIGGVLVISDAVLNGARLSPKIRLIHHAHWERIEPVAQTAPVEVLADADAAAVTAPAAPATPPTEPEKTGVLQKATRRVFGKKSKKKR